MSFDLWLAFVAASTALLLIPGPTVLLVLSYALSKGRSVAVASAGGVALGDFIAMSASLAGLGALVLASATLFNFITLLYLPLTVTGSIMFSAPIIVCALSWPLLGERVGPWRWAAIMVGFIGVLVILQPGYTVFAPAAAVPLLSALMFALYGLLTRYAARQDSAATSFFWTGTSGAVVMTVAGIWFWEPMTANDWQWMAALCITGAGGHWLLIKTYEVAEASEVQPFAYLQLVFASAIGLLLLDETLRPNVAIGAAIVVGAGLFTLWRTRKV